MFLYISIKVKNCFFRRLWGRVPHLKTNLKFLLFVLILALLTVGCDISDTDFGRQSQSTKKNTQQIIRKGTTDSYQGSPENFTGKVTVAPVFGKNAAALLAEGTLVTFEPEARTHWHTHPKGQVLIIIDGVGYTQFEGGAIEELGIGDVIVCPPNVKHWHGASPDSYMTHFVLTGEKNGKNVQWMEAVTDEQYYASKPLGQSEQI